MVKGIGFMPHAKGNLKERFSKKTDWKKGQYFKIGYYGDKLQYNIKSFKPKDLTSLCSQIKKVYVRSHAEFNCTSMSIVKKEFTNFDLSRRASFYNIVRTGC
jgi:hypothetical protein